MSTAVTAASVVEMSKGPTSSAPMSLPDNDDLLLEILLRVPPLPSSLPRAALVCKRWRRLLSHPAFLRRFRAHHRKPPMLGFFVMDFDNWLVPVFTPTLDTPDRIPPARFSFPQRPDECLWFLGCRHGLVLLMNREELEAVVWDPITGSRCCIAFPPEFEMDHLHPDIKCDIYNGAVLRDHGSGTFKVVMVFSNELYKRAWACLYESGTAKWGDIVSTMIPSSASLSKPGVLVGNSICWLLRRSGGGVLEFDTDRQSLDVISMPVDADFTDRPCVHIMRTEDGDLGFVILSEEIIQLWGRTAVSDRGVTWALLKTIELDKHIPLTPSMEAHHPTWIVGFDEDSNVIILWMATGVFMIQLESMKFTILSTESGVCSYFPYTSFYTSGLDICGGDDGAEMWTTHETMAL